MVPVGEHTLLAPVLGQVRSQPALLRRALATPADGPAHPVEDDDVPLAEVVGVVGAPSRAGAGAEVVEVAGGSPVGRALGRRAPQPRGVLVVAGTRPRLVPAPAAVVACADLREARVLVLGVAQGEDGGSVAQEPARVALAAVLAPAEATIEVGAFGSQRCPRRRRPGRRPRRWRPSPTLRSPGPTPPHQAGGLWEVASTLSCSALGLQSHGR